MSESKIEICLLSHVDYEKLVAEISIDGESAIIISQDQGVDDLWIVALGKGGPRDEVLWKIQLSDFEEALVKAKARLIG